MAHDTTTFKTVRLCNNCHYLNRIDANKCVGCEMILLVELTTTSLTAINSIRKKDFKENSERTTE